MGDLLLAALPALPPPVTAGGKDTLPRLPQASHQSTDLTSVNNCDRLRSMKCSYCQKDMEPTAALQFWYPILKGKADTFPWACRHCRTLSTERQ